MAVGFKVKYYWHKVGYGEFLHAVLFNHMLKIGAPWLGKQFIIYPFKLNHKLSFQDLYPHDLPQKKNLACINLYHHRDTVVETLITS